MGSMFTVRSSPCPAFNLQSSPRLHAAHAAVARHLPPPGTLHLAPHRMPSVRLSAARVGVQPAAELRHLQRHRHGRHVLGALLPEPCSQSAVEPSPARRLHRGRPPPPATLHLAPHRMPPFLLSVERVGVQPAAELRHLQRHGHAPDVRRALLPEPCPQSAVEPSPAHRVHRGRPPPPAAPGTLHLFPHCMPSVGLSAVRVGVQPAAEL
eukprot:scaffold70720_cov60-Phaeocystis_antarctica.AAC.2